MHDDINISPASIMQKGVFNYKKNEQLITDIRRKKIFWLRTGAMYAAKNNGFINTEPPVKKGIIICT